MTTALMGNPITAAVTTDRDLIAETPDAVLFLVFSFVDTARDLRSLSRTCKRLHQLVEERGWRIFTRSRFPSLGLPQDQALKNKELSWNLLAHSMTWQSRCWDRRSFDFRVALPKRRPGMHRNALAWPTVVDAHYNLNNRSEAVVWSERENVCVLLRRIKDKGATESMKFARISGRQSGHQSPWDDVVDVSIVKDWPVYAPGSLCVLASRMQGQLALFAVPGEDNGNDDDAGAGALPTQLADFHPRYAPEQIPGAALGYTPEQSGRVTFDVSRSGKIAASNHTSVMLYDLPQQLLPSPEQQGVGTTTTTTPTGVGPSMFLDLATLYPDATKIDVRVNAARWIDDDSSMLALGLVGPNDWPLQYVTLTPWGEAKMHRALNSTRLPQPDGSVEFGILEPGSITPLDVSSISPNRDRPLVLSAWNNSKIRLEDLRTPTPFDAVYEDNVDPWSETKHLLTFGTDRFIAGGTDGDAIRIFDFRWPKPYHHTRALACGPMRPYPPPPQPFVGAHDERWRRLFDRQAAPPRHRCDHLRGLDCTWHGLSREIYYRPNCKIYFARGDGGAKMGGVRSLAKGADYSPNFFVGLLGGIAEARLATAGGGGSLLQLENEQQQPDDREYDDLSEAIADAGFSAAFKQLGPFDEQQQGSGVVPGEEEEEREREGDPNLSFSFFGGFDYDDRDDYFYHSAPDMRHSVMETGDGLSVPDNHRNILLPPYRVGGDTAGLGWWMRGQAREHHRLDARFHWLKDYTEAWDVREIRRTEWWE